MTMPCVSISPSNTAGAPDLDALALESANHFTVNDNFAGFDFCGNTGVGTDSETAIGNVNISFKHAIHEDIPPTRYFSFDLDALTDPGWRIRRDRRRRSRRMPR